MFISMDMNNHKLVSTRTDIIVIRNANTTDTPAENNTAFCTLNLSFAIITCGCAVYRMKNVTIPVTIARTVALAIVLTTILFI